MKTNRNQTSILKFALQEWKNPEVSAEDRMTFVAHSQGGIVTSIWYAVAALGVDKDGDFNSDVARKIKIDQKYTNITEQIITLGTPFWGSKLATYMNDKEKFQLQNIPGVGLFFKQSQRCRDRLVT